jgi:hypothetical protein
VIEITICKIMNADMRHSPQTDRKQGKGARLQGNEAASGLHMRGSKRPRDKHLSAAATGKHASTSIDKHRDTPIAKGWKSLATGQDLLVSRA